MSMITTKSRYKEFGLVVYYEYDKALSSPKDLPLREVTTTLLRPTSFGSNLEVLAHTIREGDTLHRLSLKYYRDAKMWWFIADYNPTLDYLNLKVGDTVMIPPNSEVNAY